MSETKKQHNHQDESTAKYEGIIFHLTLNSLEYQKIWAGLDRLLQRYEATPFWDTQVEIRMLIEKLMSEYIAQMEAFRCSKTAFREEE